MWLIVGLGNPGAKYLLTRHNVGFMAIDNFAQGVGAPPYKTQHKSLITKFKLDGEDIILAKPQTYMNLSGEAVREIMDYYHVELQNVLIVHDDLDLNPGQLKLQKNRGPGGHNGLKSLNEHLSTQDYSRLKIGIGRPPIPQMEIATYVLQNFGDQDMPLLKDTLNRASDGIESVIFNGFEKTANDLNRKDP